MNYAQNLMGYICVYMYICICIRSCISLSTYIYIYIYIYLYNRGPISRVQGSKARSPQIVHGEKNDFRGVPVSEVSFHRLEASPFVVGRSVLIVFEWLWGPLGLSKTWIPLSTSVKNQVFGVFASKTPLGRAFDAFWSGWMRLQSLSRRPFGGPLATLTGVPVRQIRFFRASGRVGL